MKKHIKKLRNEIAEMDWKIRTLSQMPSMNRSHIKESLLKRKELKEQELRGLERNAKIKKILED